jgi:HEPN domain-containing protein
VNRRDLQVLTRVRLDEARLLLDAGRYDGAYYLSGYAVECALKACIASRTRTHDFPPKPNEVRGMYVHDPTDLVRAARLVESLADRIQSCSMFSGHWNTVREWSEESRYERRTEAYASTLFVAITDPEHGVLRWLREHW